MEALVQFLTAHCTDGLLPWSAQTAAAKQFGLSLASIEMSALEAGILPTRYWRNGKTISIPSQRKLFQSRVVVVGCGGLGGYVIEELARLGVGTIVAVDPDVFEEHNLNRQVLSTIHTLGCAKVDIAAKRISEINPAVSLIPVKSSYRAAVAAELFAGTNAVVDALDSIPDRLALAVSCDQLRIPLVHGAIAGWYGQVTTQLPGTETISKLYGRSGEQKGVEQYLGNPSFTPAVVASIEAAEVCKVLLGLGESLQGRILIVDLLAMTFHEITIQPAQSAVITKDEST